MIFFSFLFQRFDRLDLLDYANSKGSTDFQIDILCNINPDISAATSAMRIRINMRSRGRRPRAAPANAQHIV
jgi:hypothetical protein